MIELLTAAPADELYRRADQVRHDAVGDEVHLRGLIEFSNICRNDCMYCGIRRSNRKVQRYRMDDDELVETARRAVEMGFQTIVLQSGEDLHFDQSRMCRIIERIKAMDVALTLSIGERKGTYPGMLQKRQFRLIFVDDAHPFAWDPDAPGWPVQYDGQALTIKL